jgi:hypothetical protein
MKDAVAQQTAYLDKADEIVGAYIKNLGDKVGELSDPAAQGKHFAAIQSELVKAFPDYAFPDLVGYSVYGSAQQKLSKSARQTQILRAPRESDFAGGEFFPPMGDGRLPQTVDGRPMN